MIVDAFIAEFPLFLLFSSVFMVYVRYQLLSVIR